MYFNYTQSEKWFKYSSDLYCYWVTCCTTSANDAKWSPHLQLILFFCTATTLQLHLHVRLSVCKLRQSRLPFKEEVSFFFFSCEDVCYMWFSRLLLKVDIWNFKQRLLWPVILSPIIVIFHYRYGWIFVLFNL